MFGDGLVVWWLYGWFKDDLGFVWSFYGVVVWLK